MTITVTVSDKKTATSHPESNDLKRGKQRARTTERMCTRKKQDTYKEEREYAHSITRKKLQTKLLFQQAATTYYNYNYS